MSLEGVSNVEVLKGEKAGTQKVIVTSSSSELTKEQAIKSLGDNAKKYVVEKWQLADDAAKSALLDAARSAAPAASVAPV